MVGEVGRGGDSMPPPIEDDLLEKLTGKWNINRRFANRAAENVAVGEWVLEHHYLRITMTDVIEPPKYAAHIYITYEAESKRYVIHWMDAFAGSMPEALGYGTRSGDTLVFVWKDADGVLQNTFTWHPESDTWISLIEQTDSDGNWATFCTDTYTHA